MRGFVRADLLEDVEEALRRIDYAEFKVEDWGVKNELDAALRVLYRLKNELELEGV